MAGIFFLELMETHVTLLIASISNMFHQPILHQPSVTLELAEHSLMPWGDHLVQPAALDVNGLQTNALQKGPDLPLVLLQPDISQHQSMALILGHDIGSALHG